MGAGGEGSVEVAVVPGGWEDDLLGRSRVPRVEDEQRDVQQRSRMSQHPSELSST